MRASQLVDQLKFENLGLLPCTCGGSVKIEYEAGCSYVWCDSEQKAVMSLPDWQIAELAKKWNNRNV